MKASNKSENVPSKGYDAADSAKPQKRINKTEGCNKLATMGRDAKSVKIPSKMTPATKPFSRQRPTSTVEITELPKSDDETGKPRTTVYTRGTYSREPNAEVDNKTRYTSAANKFSSRRSNVAAIEAKKRTSDDSSEDDTSPNAKWTNKKGVGNDKTHQINILECSREKKVAETPASTKKVTIRPDDAMSKERRNGGKPKRAREMAESKMANKENADVNMHRPRMARSHHDSQNGESSHDKVKRQDGGTIDSQNGGRAITKQNGGRAITKQNGEGAISTKDGGRAMKERSEDECRNTRLTNGVNAITMHKAENTRSKSVRPGDAKERTSDRKKYKVVRYVDRDTLNIETIDRGIGKPANKNPTTERTTIASERETKQGAKQARKENARDKMAEAHIRRANRMVAETNMEEPKYELSMANLEGTQI